MKSPSLAAIPPGSPHWPFALVLGALVFHIAAAGTGIVSGYVATGLFAAYLVASAS